MPEIRAATRADAAVAAPLIYEPLAGGYDVYAGPGEPALRLVTAAYERRGTICSSEAVTLAEVDGVVAGAMAAYPAAEMRRRERALLYLALRRRPPWLWGRIVRLFAAGERHAPSPPPDTLYVKSLATAAGFRRRGVARALLVEASRQAKAQGLAGVSLDTAARNLDAQAVYERLGFRVTERLPPRGEIPGILAYLRELDHGA